MANTTMKAYKVSEIAFVNNVKGKVELKMKTKVSHNVRFTKNGSYHSNGVFKIARMVHLAAKRMGRKIGRIRLDEQSVVRYA